MKNKRIIKTVLAAIILCLTFNMLGCGHVASAPTKPKKFAKVVKKQVKDNNVKKASEEEIDKAKNIYREYLKSYSDQDNPIKDLVLVDLNSDGMPELFCGYTSRAYCPVNVVLSVKDGQLVKLNIQRNENGISGNNYDNGKSDIGLRAFSNIKLYKSRKTNEYSFIGKDSSSINSDEWREGEYVISLDGNTINSKQIFYRISMQDDKSNQPRKYVLAYKYCGNEISKSEYDTKYKEYFNDLEEVSMKIYTGYTNGNSEEKFDDFLDEGFKVFGDNKKIADEESSQKNNNNTQNQSSNASVKDSNQSTSQNNGQGTITPEQAEQLVAKNYKVDIKYECNVKLDSGFRIDGKPSEQYYCVYGKQNGQRLEGAFYVHSITGAVYENDSDGSIYRLPNKTFVGMYGDK